MTTARSSVLLLSALVLGCASASATGEATQRDAVQDAPRETATEFHWQGRVARSATVEVLGVNGSIRAVESGDGSVRVDAAKRARRSDPGSVRIEVVEHSDGVTLCAVYPTPEGAGRPNECRPGGRGMDVRNNDVRVDFEVRVPAGVRLAASTVNGNVSAEGLDSDVKATAVNGNVAVRTAGVAEARTVNGNVTARLGSTRLPDGIRFEAVNGNVILEMPDGTGARLRASTVHGRVTSDFPVSGRLGPRTVRGTIGGGGPELRISTVNGSIRLRRAEGLREN